MRKFITLIILATLLTSCSSLQLQLSTLNHASIQHKWRTRTNTGFNYVLPSTIPYTWNNFTYNRFLQPDPFFYSWNYPLNWYYPNQFGYTFNYNNIVRPRRVVRRTPARPQVQPRPTIRRPRTRTRVVNPPTRTRPQTRVSTSNTRRGKSNIKQ